MRPCFAFSAAKATDAPELLSIYDEIGFWGVQAADFRTSLSNVKSSTLDVEISSPGGDTFVGLAIYNMLRSSGKTVNVRITGVAASAASLIAMAGDTITMPKNTFMMIHNPWSYAMGNAEELRGTADMLEKVQASLTATYVDKTGMAEAEMVAMLSKDTWMTADECLQMGFCTEVVEDVIAFAKFDMARADRPENVKSAMTAPAVETKDEVIIDQPADDLNPVSLETLTEPDPLAETIAAEAVTAGFDAFAASWALSCTTLAHVQARIASATQIKSLCNTLGKPDAAAAFITGNQSMTEVRAALVLAAAEADADSHIDTTQEIQKTQTTRSSANPKVTASKIWDSHNAQKRKP